MLLENRPALMSRIMWSSKMVMRSYTSAPLSPCGKRYQKRPNRRRSVFSRSLPSASCGTCNTSIERKGLAHGLVNTHKREHCRRSKDVLHGYVLVRVITGVPYKLSLAHFADAVTGCQ